MTAAERMARSRKRRQAGGALVHLELDADVIASLMRLGWLRSDAPTIEAHQAVRDLLMAALYARIQPAGSQHQA
jgi:hypothetical protein